MAPCRWDLVFQSRSGPPSVPWLEPDVNDHLRGWPRDATGCPPVGGRRVPVGFVSDHMEVVHDLDVEAAETAASLGLAVRAGAGARLDPAVRRGWCASWWRSGPDAPGCALAAAGARRVRAGGG